LTTYQASRRPARLFIGGAIVLALVVGGVVGALVARSSPSPHAVRHTRPPAAIAPTSTAPAAPQSLTVTQVSPAPNAVGIAPTAPITVTLSSPPAPHSPLPTLTPATAGSWQIQGTALTFTPTVPFSPLSEITLTVPGGPSGVAGANGALLGQATVEQFRIANGSVLRLQQLLSLLDYSPLAWSPTGTAPSSTDAAAQVAALYAPPPGTFSWIDRGWPRHLRALWQPGVNSVFTRGLVMSFQADHGLAPTGRVGPDLWSALMQAVAANTVNTGGYNFAFANKAAPETLTIYHNGRVVLRAPANTGIAASPTPDGTFPVNTRLRRQIMRGTNPNGQHYADLVQFIAYFHGNDAVHYMDRADYGIPQSLGCIELPLADAARAWPYLAYGTLVMVIN